MNDSIYHYGLIITKTNYGSRRLLGYKEDLEFIKNEIDGFDFANFYFVDKKEFDSYYYLPIDTVERHLNA